MRDYTNTHTPIEIFYSYSHKDERLRNELEKHLSILRQRGVIRDWHDRKISGGSDWNAEIDSHIETSNIILLLISSDFLASEYIRGVELKRAMERHRQGEARVIPIMLRPVDWEGAPFSELQALPRDAKPVTRWRTTDEAFEDIAKGIRRIIEELFNSRPPLPVVNTSGPNLKLGSISTKNYHQTLASEIQAIGDKYLPKHYTERLIDNLVRDFLESDSKLFLLIDAAGSGKTSLCCHLAEQIIHERPVAFVNCGQADNVFDEISRQLLSMTGHGWDYPVSNPLIILDAINEFDSPSIMRHLLSQLFKQLPSVNAQCLVSCRDIAWPYFDPDKQSHSLRSILFRGETFPTGSFTDDALDQTFRSYFELFAVEGEIRGRARTSLAHPLLLRLFCEAYAGESVGRVSDVYLKELFEIYLARKRSEITQRLHLVAPQAVDEFLESIAQVLWYTDGTPLPEAFSGLPHGGLNPIHGSLYAVLLETQILLEKEHASAVRRVTFKYEAFQDFITARMLYRDIVRNTGKLNPSLDDCADRIGREPERSTLETIAGFLFTISRDPNDLDAHGWERLCTRSPMYARSSIRALRQVPAAKMLPSELRLLVSLADSSDPDTLRLAMDAVADRYAYLPADLRRDAGRWVDSGYPGLAARLIVENFGLFEETDWPSIWHLLKRDRSEISHRVLLDFAADRLRDGHSSPELKRLLVTLRDSADLGIAREADARLKVLPE
jgi:hypothetical protein